MPFTELNTEECLGPTIKIKLRDVLEESDSGPEDLSEVNTKKYWWILTEVGRVDACAKFLRIHCPNKRYLKIYPNEYFLMNELKWDYVIFNINDMSLNYQKKRVIQSDLEQD